MVLRIEIREDVRGQHVVLHLEGTAAIFEDDRKGLVGQGRRKTRRRLSGLLIWLGVTGTRSRSRIQNERPMTLVWVRRRIIRSGFALVVSVTALVGSVAILSVAILVVTIDALIVSIAVLAVIGRLFVIDRIVIAPVAELEIEAVGVSISQPIGIVVVVPIVKITPTAVKPVMIPAVPAAIPSTIPASVPATRTPALIRSTATAESVSVIRNMRTVVRNSKARIVPWNGPAKTRSAPSAPD